MVGMTNEDVARILLAGEYSRRRGYLSQALVTWQQVAVMGTAAIWALILQSGDSSALAGSVVFASALSSLLIGIWRLYSRMLDNTILSMYPMLYVCERILVPGPACTVNTPKGQKELTPQLAAGELCWTAARVRNVDFGHRLHRGTDVIAWLAIGSFLALSLYMGVREGLIGVGVADVKFVLLLSAIIGGGLLILVSWLTWRFKTHAWPTPLVANAGDQVAAPVTAAEGPGGVSA